MNKNEIINLLKHIKQKVDETFGSEKFQTTLNKFKDKYENSTPEEQKKILEKLQSRMDEMKNRKEK